VAKRAAATTAVNSAAVIEHARALVTAFVVDPAFHFLTGDQGTAFHALARELGIAIPADPGVGIPERVEPELELSDDQKQAWSKLERWLGNGKSYFVLRGFAGTGKTFLLRKLAKLDINVFFTAPTNKAAKVLSRSVGTGAKTTYSFLGLRMVHDEDKLVLDFGKEKPHIPRNSVIVVDEGSMVGKQLVSVLKTMVEETGCKILVVGDPAQLPPVGEATSPVWNLTADPECRAVLRQVMRNDNQILAASMAVRSCLKNKVWRSPLVDDNADGTGVFLHTKPGFERAIRGLDVEDFAGNKVVAWRNRTVDRYTKMIRSNLGFTDEYQVGEHLLLASPIEQDGSVIAHVDEEFRVRAVTESVVRVDDTDIPVYAVTVDGDQQLDLKIPSDTTELQIILGHKAAAARATGSKGMRARLWREFWETKAKFHEVRYGYAMTAHRVQGSTHAGIYLDQADVLANPDKREAFRCLYVGVTRPTHQLHAF